MYIMSLHSNTTYSIVYACKHTSDTYNMFVRVILALYIYIYIYIYILCSSRHQVCIPACSSESTSAPGVVTISYGLRMCSVSLSCVQATPQQL